MLPILSFETIAATAPFSNACSTKSCPSNFSPRTAKKSSPGLIVRESIEYPTAIVSRLKSVPISASGIRSDSATRHSGNFMHLPQLSSSHSQACAALPLLLAYPQKGQGRTPALALSHVPCLQAARYLRGELPQAQFGLRATYQLRSHISPRCAAGRQLHR